MKTVCSILLIILISTANYAQQTITGKISNYQSGIAEVLMPSQNPQIIGSVNENGYFNILLNDSIINKMLEDQRKAKEEGQRVRVRNNTVREAFYCDSVYVKTINGEQVLESPTVSGMFLIGILKDKKPIGKLRLSSSESFSESYFSYGKKDYIPGYYVDFYYVSEDASVNGICKTKTYTLDMQSTFDISHEYNINLKKGWNIVKIEVVEVYEDQEGHSRPLTYKMQTINKLPKDVKFIFTPGDKL